MKPLVHVNIDHFKVDYPITKRQPFYPQSKMYDIQFENDTGFDTCLL